jgi:hypothetical protein
MVGLNERMPGQAAPTGGKFATVDGGVVERDVLRLAVFASTSLVG